jgi:hypothetical protein
MLLLDTEAVIECGLIESVSNATNPLADAEFQEPSCSFTAPLADAEAKKPSSLQV